MHLHLPQVIMAYFTILLLLALAAFILLTKDSVLEAIKQTFG